MLRFAPLLSAALSAGLAVAQTPELTVRGGSLGGTIELELRGGQFGQVGLIFMSFSPGPTPLSLLDPTDSRSLSVGLDLIGLTLNGPLLLPPVFTPPPIPVPNMPAIIDAGMFFHGASLPGATHLIDQLSDPRAFRFGAPNTFRDRFVSIGAGRSFFPIIRTDGGAHLAVGGGAGALFAQIARKDTEWFDPISDTFSFGPDMHVERSLHTATRLNDGRWLIVGGVNRSNDPTESAEIFDPVTATFNLAAPMVTPRAGHAAALLPNGRVLVSGGITDMTSTPTTPLDPVYSITTSTEIYDPATDTWAPGPNLRDPRAGHLAIARGDGRVLLAGGVSWYTFIIRLPSVETSTDMFDPATGRITAGPSLRQARAIPSIVSIGSGRWLLAGGVGQISLTQQGTPTAAAEIYDESANSFTATAAMSQRRTLHQAHALGNGRFLHIGGGDGTLFAVTPMAASEIWDAATGTWSAGPSLVTPRVAYGSYETPTGQIHVLSGDTPAGVGLTTEFYFR